jgi:hypothetical protein
MKEIFHLFEPARRRTFQDRCWRAEHRRDHFKYEALYRERRDGIHPLPFVIEANAQPRQRPARKVGSGVQTVGIGGIEAIADTLQPRRIHLNLEGV